MKNGTGNKKDSTGNPKTEVFDEKSFKGAKINQNIGGLPCNYLIGVANKAENIEVSTVSRIDPNGKGSALWSDLNENGILTEKSEDKNLKDGKDVCIAVSGKLKLAPQQMDKIEMAFVWDAPQVKFPNSAKIYSKYYTKFFDSGLKVLAYALKSYVQWEDWIVDWQKDVLNDK